MAASGGALEDCKSKDMDLRITSCSAALKAGKFDKKNRALVHTYLITTSGTTSNDMP
jgi:hypothetical protein